MVFIWTHETRILTDFPRFSHGMTFLPATDYPIFLRKTRIRMKNPSNPMVRKNAA